MKRCVCGGFLLLLVLCTATSAAAYGETDDISSFRWGPYLTGTTVNTTVINWMSATPGNGSVSYATDAAYRTSGAYTRRVTAGADSTLHHVVLTGLLPDTPYHYQVTSGGRVSDDHTFRTFPETGPFTFIVYGDTQEQLPYFTQAERHALVAERIAATEPETLFVLHVGDTVCDAESEDEWNRFFAAGRPLFENTTLVPVLGNHENNASIWYEAFGMPEWYSFDCGGAHVAVLDSNDWAARHFDEEAAWLKTDLEENRELRTDAPEAPVFVSFHHPPYSSGTRHPGGWTDIRELWCPILEDAGVDVVFNGHVHSYQRYVVNDVQYMIAATGGGVLYDLTEEKTEGYAGGADHELGYLRVTVDGDCITSVFVPVAAVSQNNREVISVFPVGTEYDPVRIGACRDGICNVLAGISDPFSHFFSG